MSVGDRLGLATRAFFVATLLGLSLAFPDTDALQGLVLLLVIGTLALAAHRFSFVPTRWICLVEGLLAALTIGITLPAGALLAPYLMVPVVLVGVTASVRAVVAVAGGEALALLLVLALGAGSSSVGEGLELTAPWAVASLGAGLMAVWVVQLRGNPLPGDEASYESARRLLGQLRTVARRLSSGLDAGSMAEQLLGGVHRALQDSRSALFVRTEGGVLAPLAYRGTDAQHVLQPAGPLVDECWETGEPVHGTVTLADGAPQGRHRTVLPLRSGSRLIGLVVADAPSPPPPPTLRALMQELDEQSLRLDTALVFDEVRSLATREERQRLAREIHDGVAQEVASLGYAVDDLAAEAGSDAQAAGLQALRAEITRVVSELRLSIFDLRSDVSQAAGLGSALSDYVRAVGARSGLTVHLTLDEAPTRLRGEVETELLRIAQEAVMNARKHSHAENLWVDCRVHPPYARITVQDDGTGLGEPRSDSYGLRIMRERAERIHASLHIGPAESLDGGRGTRVTVTVGEETAAVR